MNIVIISGRTTKEWETITTATGNTVAKNSLAVDSGYGDKKKTDYINLVAFGKTAESLAAHSFKGQKLTVEGRLNTGSYEKKDGTKVYTTDVVINSTEFNSYKDSSAQPKSEPKKQESPAGFEALEEDIPF